MKTTYAQAAQSIKKELVAKFPGVKFSVKSEGFPMGNAVDINWTNGPTVAQVEKISSRYEEGRFDGMYGTYEYYKNRPKTKGSAKYVHAHRHIDKEGYNAMVRDLRELNGVEFVTDIIYRIMYNTSIPTGSRILGLERTDCEAGQIEELYRVKIGYEEK